jgi:hypothetical protein
MALSGSSKGFGVALSPAAKKLTILIWAAHSYSAGSGLIDNEARNLVAAVEVR